MSHPDCTDVCEIVMGELERIGFRISDDEDHTDVIEVLQQCHLVRDSPGPFILLNWNNYEDIAIVTDVDGAPMLFSTIQAADKAAKEKCAFNYKVVGL